MSIGSIGGMIALQNMAGALGASVNMPITGGASSFTTNDIAAQPSGGTVAGLFQGSDMKDLIALAIISNMDNSDRKKGSDPFDILKAAIAYQAINNLFGAEGGNAAGGADAGMAGVVAVGGMSVAA